ETKTASPRTAPSFPYTTLFRSLDVVGPNRRELVAFARLDERDAIIVVTGRLFGRATQNAARWPPAQAWNASVLAEGFSQIRNVRSEEHTSELQSRVELVCRLLI